MATRLPVVKFGAVEASSQALGDAINPPEFGFWEFFGKMFLAEKSVVEGALVQDAMVNWKVFWAFPSILAIAVAVIFAVTFWDKTKSD